MMRFQSMSQEHLSLPNGRKPNPKLIREEEEEDHQITNLSYSSSKAPAYPRIRPGPDSSSPLDGAFPPPPPSPPPRAPLKWGQRKRSRGSRTDPGRASAEEPLSRPAKVPRRSAAGGSHCKGLGLRSSASNLHRSVDERSNGRRSPPHQTQRTATRGGNGGTMAAAAELTNPPSTPEVAVERAELPKIFLNLSRKEKEVDFLLMKGSKLPQRPKRRVKSVEKALQYIYPGMWLSDLSRGRYEVREKKCAKKKRRGLKGMESMESDSY